jgi:hypothetical protein
VPDEEHVGLYLTSSRHLHGVVLYTATPVFFFCFVSRTFDMTHIAVAYGEAKRGWTSRIERVLKCESTVTGVLFVFIEVTCFKHILAMSWKFRVLSLFQF